MSAETDMQTVVTMRDPRPEAIPRAEAAAGTPRAPAPQRQASPHDFLPLLLALLAVAGWTGFQAWQLLHERQQLQEARAGLQPALERATLLRQSLDQLATDTRRLADGGHAPARALVDELARRGVTIQMPPPAASDATPTGAPTRR
jgi:hypothetical protein